MAKQCARCGKSSQMQTTRKLLRGHYNPTARKRKYPNLQWMSNPDGTRARACTQCLRTAAKAPRARVSRQTEKAEIKSIPV